MALLPKVRLPALGALLTTIAGVISSPLVLGLVGDKWAAVVIGIGTTWQALTKAIHHDEPPASDGKRP